MKIGIMTFHMAHNYGAMLQAYALPLKLKSMGYDAEIIDYRLKYIDQWGRVDSLRDLVSVNGVIGGGLRYLKRCFTGEYSPSKKKNKFNSFMKNNIIHSENCYRKEEELSEVNYDVIIFGSDQIWNERLTNNQEELDFVYLGKNVSEGTKLIAYAASNGREYFPERYKLDVEKYLTRFSAIGVREKGLAQYIDKEYQLDVKSVFDPTLLISKQEWINSLNINIKKGEPYLLVYTFETGDSVYQFARKIANYFNLKLIAITYEKSISFPDYQLLSECGPKDFVELIANANYVCTSSFHGLAFAINFEKEFFCIPHPDFHERTDSLLDQLDLLNRNITKDKMYCDIDMHPIDWPCVTKKIETLRAESLDFLRDALNE